MTTKTFQAETMLEALQKVQEEMGPDAVVISARNIPIGPAWQVWKKPGVEIISVSADEANKVQNIAQKNKQQSEILRPDKNGRGVEFVEERPAIEWETYTSAPAIVKSGTLREESVQQTDEIETGDARIYTQPRYIKNDERHSKNWMQPDHQQMAMGVKENIRTARQPFPRTNQQPATPSNRKTCPEALRKQLDKLDTQGVASEYLNQLENLALKGCSPTLLSNETRVKEFLASSISANIPVRKWPVSEAPGRVMAFVGLSGIGKTNALAKTAIFYSSLVGKNVVWVCADSIKTGAIMEARTYTEAIGIPLELAYTPAELRSAVDRNSGADLILVDTPGFNPCLEEQEVELGSLLVELPEAYTLLVTSATARESDSLRCFHSLKYFGLKGSIISKMDETASFGTALNFILKSHLPITFFTSGRKASTGLKIADADLLVNSLFGKGW